MSTVDNGTTLAIICKCLLPVKRGKYEIKKINQNQLFLFDILPIAQMLYLTEYSLRKRITGMNYF